MILGLFNRKKTEAKAASARARHGRGLPGPGDRSLCAAKAYVRPWKLIVLALVFSLSAPGISMALVGKSRHNFGSLSPAEVKSPDNTEICVFCHTPHNSKPETPIWNKELSGENYDVYQSETMVAPVGQPTGSSKLCLSCHDGTIAVGSLLNLPGIATTGTFAVTGPGVTPEGKISPTSTSYIGTDLRDDHPISFDYAQSYPSNTEIKSDTALPSEVKLDRNNNIQCTSCHDAHGTDFPKFLVAAYEGGGLCTACHDKRYWDTLPSIHRDSTATWNGQNENPWHEDMGAAGYSDDTPQLHSCMACHRSHGGAAGMNLLKGTNPGTGAIEDEEWTCLNCHNGNVASKDMEPLFDYLSRHDVKGVYASHTPARENPGDPARETSTNLGLNRHAECVDCHNPHGVRNGNHEIGGINGNIIGANSLGGWGVKPDTWPVAGEKALSYLEVDFTTLAPGGDNLEGYLCIKCHSYYAYGDIPPSVPSGNADGSYVLESDATEDFNPNNKSFHPVFDQGMNRPPSTANPNWPANGLGLTNTFRYVDWPELGGRTDWYRVTHDSRMTCTDCHGTGLSTDPQGPHGSDNRWILRNNETGIGSFANFCYNCHRREVYGDEDYVGPEADFSRVPHPVDGLGATSPFYQSGVGTGNDSNKFQILCLTCHGGSHDATVNVMKGVHGSNAGPGPETGSDDLGYRMMNGACVESHVAAKPNRGVKMWFRTVDPVTDTVCNNNFTSFTGNEAIYRCNNVIDCSN